LGTNAARILDGREGSTAAKTALIAQYAPTTPRITLKIVVLMIKNATKSALTLTALAGSHSANRAAANVLLYPHLTPAAVNN
jgi:hypothetical protein